MAEIRIRTVGPKPQDILKQLTLQFISVSDGIKTLGVLSQERMVRNLKFSKTRPEGSRNNLEQSIKVYYEGDTVTGFSKVGVGKIADLDVLAPYWLLINNGGFSEVARQRKTIFGYFGSGNAPDASLRGTGIGHESFFTNVFGAKGNFAMSPRSPIAPHNYIEKTFAYINSITRVHFSGWLKRKKIF